MKKTRKFGSNGMLWNDGEIPKCDFCEKDFDEVDELCETPFSGGLVCETQECRQHLLESMLQDRVEEHEEEDEEEENEQ